MEYKRIVMLMKVCCCAFGVMFCLSCTSQNKPKKVIVKGEGKLSKKLFFRANVETIYSIIQGKLDDKVGLDVGVFSDFALHIINPDNKKISKIIRFKIGVGKPQILYQEKEGEFLIIDGEGARLLDNKGKTFWEYKENDEYSIKGMVTGDLDFDNKFEYYVASNKGLIKLDQAGKIEWCKKEEVDQVAMFEPGKGKEAFVVTTSPHKVVRSQRYLKYRDINGSVIKEFNV